jgi:hypothetical protein
MRTNIYIFLLLMPLFITILIFVEQSNVILVGTYVEVESYYFICDGAISLRHVLILC